MVSASIRIFKGDSRKDFSSPSKRLMRATTGISSRLPNERLGKIYEYLYDCVGEAGT